jgi:SAM-dependent methyltransferase
MAYGLRIERRIESEKFHPTWFGVMVSPFFLIRRGLITAIKQTSEQFAGDVLDFGCGSKPYRKYFPHASQYVGVDIEVSGHVHQDSQIDYFYDGVTLPFPDASFDHVVSFEVFEHVFNIEQILTEISRVLRPGGNLFFSLPFAWGEHEAPYDFGRYTSFGITSLLERGDFTVESIAKTNHDVEAIAQLFANYVYETLAPRQTVLKSLFQLVIICPITVIGLFLGRILPSSGSVYSNMVVTATKA